MQTHYFYLFLFLFFFCIKAKKNNKKKLRGKIQLCCFANFGIRHQAAAVAAVSIGMQRRKPSILKSFPNLISFPSHKCRLIIV